MNKDEMYKNLSKNDHQNRLIAHNLLSRWEWPENLVGPKPEGWDYMNSKEKHKNKIFRATYDALDEMLSDFEILEFHWDVNMKKSHDEFLEWWLSDARYDPYRNRNYKRHLKTA